MPTLKLRRAGLHTFHFGKPAEFAYRMAGKPAEFAYRIAGLPAEFAYRIAGLPAEAVSA